MELKDKIPPHNLEAEQATLGAMLLNWESVNEVVLYIRSSHFYDQRNQIIFDSLV
ncbi:MAG: replicative DNA helicase, partial [Treponema sp.]|nr:replicative DNA helicase [Treponema sp.]